MASTVATTTSATKETQETQSQEKEIQSQKKSVTFNIKQQKTIFLKLSCKEGKKM
jgi:hypothetical protein